MFQWPYSVEQLKTTAGAKGNIFIYKMKMVEDQRIRPIMKTVPELYQNYNKAALHYGKHMAWYGKHNNQNHFKQVHFLIYYNKHHRSHYPRKHPRWVGRFDTICAI